MIIRLETQSAVGNGARSPTQPHSSKEVFILVKYNVPERKTLRKEFLFCLCFQRCSFVIGWLHCWGLTRGRNIVKKICSPHAKWKSRDRGTSGQDQISS